MLEPLVASGADIDAAGPRGLSPLGLAVELFDDSVRFASRPPPDLPPDILAVLPSAMAQVADRLTKVSVLINRGAGFQADASAEIQARFDLKATRMMTPLQLAAFIDAPEGIFSELTGREFVSVVRADDLNAALAIASRRGHSTSANALVDAGARVAGPEASPVRGRSPSR
jgi:hypothetical protein